MGSNPQTKTYVFHELHIAIIDIMEKKFEMKDPKLLLTTLSKFGKDSYYVIMLLYYYMYIPLYSNGSNQV